MKRYELISRWHFAAPIDRVWDALYEVSDWPTWWPYVLTQFLSMEWLEGQGSVRQRRTSAMGGDSRGRCRLVFLDGEVGARRGCYCLSGDTLCPLSLSIIFKIDLCAAQALVFLYG